MGGFESSPASSLTSRVPVRANFAFHEYLTRPDVWNAVERRLAVVKASFASGSSPGLCRRSFSAEYLLSGFLKCGVCASKMVVVSGRGQSERARYGCPMKHARHLHERSPHQARPFGEGSHWRPSKAGS